MLQSIQSEISRMYAQQMRCLLLETNNRKSKHLTYLYQQGGNQGPEGILGAEMVLAASNAPSALGEHSKSVHVSGIPVDPEANPPEFFPKSTICYDTIVDDNEDL